MAECVVSPVLDADRNQQFWACMVHTTWAPCPRNGQPGSTGPVELTNDTGAADVAGADPTTAADGAAQRVLGRPPRPRRPELLVPAGNLPRGWGNPRSAGEPAAPLTPTLNGPPATAERNNVVHLFFAGLENRRPRMRASDHTASHTNAAVEPRRNDGDEFVHDVTWLEWLLGDVLRVKIPRARCGVLLVGDPDRPDPLDLDAPMCPRCAELAGYDQDDVERINRRLRP